MSKSIINDIWGGIHAALQGAAEKIRTDKRLRWRIALCARYFLCGLLLLAWTIAASRYGQKQALETYTGWLADYEAAQEAAAQEAIEQDPYTIQLKHEAMLFAKCLAGISEFHYDDQSKETFLQGIWNRVVNDEFPDTIEQVLLQPGAFDMYDASNKPIEADYQLAYRYLDKIHQSETLLCDPDMVFIKLGRDRVTLRDTLIETGSTNYWRVGQ